MTPHFVELAHSSPEVDASYDLFLQDIPPEFLEEREFLRNRLRVRDEGPKNERERILVQEGYTLHLISAKDGDKIIGSIYGHLISKITPDNRAIGFVTYISVLREHRRKGIGSLLIDKLHGKVEQDSLRLTGKPIVGMVYEIEAEAKEEIKCLLRKQNGRPLDITYYQPALRRTTAAEQMHLWFHPLDPPLTSPEQYKERKYPAEFVISMVRNLLTREYVGPDMKGFDLTSTAYREFLRSIGQRKEIGFLNTSEGSR